MLSWSCIYSLCLIQDDWLTLTSQKREINHQMFVLFLVPTNKYILI
jgi:hypothetical protein